MRIVCELTPFCKTLESKLRPLLQQIFGPDFDQDAWENCLGGTHVTLRYDEDLVGHASVINRAIWIGRKPTEIKYVEAVAIHPDLQNQQLGHTVMGAINFLIHQSNKAGFLATSSVGFYRSLRWEVWQGDSYVKMADGRFLPSSPRGEIMFLQPRCLELDPSKIVTVGWRKGDVW